MQLTNKELAQLLSNLQTNHIFSVTFIKRTTGEVRQMNCRKGVSKGVKGIGLSYDPKAHNLLGVFDMANDGFRMLNLENLISAKIDGQEYIVTDTTCDFSLNHA